MEPILCPSKGTFYGQNFRPCPVPIYLWLSHAGTIVGENRNKIVPRGPRGTPANRSGPYYLPSDWEDRYAIGCVEHRPTWSPGHRHWKRLAIHTKRGQEELAAAVLTRKRWCVNLLSTFQQCPGCERCKGPNYPGF